jgi:hypothetical protein
VLRDDAQGNRKRFAGRKTLVDSASAVAAEQHPSFPGLALHHLYAIDVPRGRRTEIPLSSKARRAGNGGEIGSQGESRRRQPQGSL